MRKVTPGRRLRNTALVARDAAVSRLGLRPQVTYKAAVTLADRALNAADLVVLLEKCGLAHYGTLSPRYRYGQKGSAA